MEGSTLKIGFLNPLYTFTHLAALLWHPRAELVGFVTIADLLQAHWDGLVDQTVVPVENGSIGGISDTLLRLRNRAHVGGDVKIVGELTVPVQFVLAACEGATLESIRIVYSKEQALSQCSKLFDQYGWQKEVAASTSAAAEIVDQETNPSLAALVSLQAAEHYGLQILQAECADNNNNATRFLVLGRHELIPTSEDKTTLLVRTEDKPGALVDVLLPFKEAGINMSCLQSLPALTAQVGTYLFWIDVQQHRSTPAMEQVIAQLRSGAAEEVMILGSYPKGN